MKSHILVLVCLSLVTRALSDCSPLCLRCNDADPGTCLECPSGLDIDGPECRSVLADDDFNPNGLAEGVCFDHNCINCPGYRTTCEDCTSGYLAVEGECIATNLPDCETVCDTCIYHNGPYCLECFDPYISKNGKCSVVCEDTCVDCVDSDGPWCLECVNGYHEEIGRCVVNPPNMAAPPAPIQHVCRVPHCTACRKKTETDCEICDQGFESDGNNGCQAVCLGDYCDVCDREDGQKCIECRPLYKLDMTDGLCKVPCNVPNCLACLPGRPELCLECADGYVRDEHTNCAIPMEGCWDTNCVDCANTQDDCSICLLGFRSVEHECIETHTPCDETCLDCYMPEDGGPLCLSCVSSSLVPVLDGCQTDDEDGA